MKSRSRARSLKSSGKRISHLQNRSPEFEAGQLFERMLADNSSHISRADFLKLYDKLRVEKDRRGVKKGDSFEAGRIFERYDKDKNGTMTKNDFVKFFNDFNRTRDFPLQERRGLPRPYLRHDNTRYYDDRLRSSSPRRLVSPIYDSEYGRRSRFDTLRMPVNRVNTAVDPLISGSPRTSRYRIRPYDSNSSDSNVEHRLLHQLDRKIRLLIQQSENVKHRMIDIQDACEETERETVNFFQPMIDRVRDVESRLLADLQRDLDILNQEADLVNTYAQRVEECGGDYKELLRLIPTVNDIVDRPFKRHFDMPEVRIPREAYDCARALDDIEGAESALRAKDHMIWKLMKERKEDKDQVHIAQSESQTIGERSAQEIAKWKKMSNEFLEKFEKCDEELYHAQNTVKEEQERLVRSCVRLEKHLFSSNTRMKS